MALAATCHVRRLVSTLHEPIARESKLRDVTNDHKRVHDLFYLCNTMTVPMLVVIASFLFVFGVCGLDLLNQLFVGVSVREIIFHCVLGMLGIIGGTTLLQGMAVVADTYESALEELIDRDLGLINLAEEIFPNYGMSFLVDIRTAKPLSFRMVRITINGQLMISTLASVLLGIIITVGFSVLKLG